MNPNRGAIAAMRRDLRWKSPGPLAGRAWRSGAPRLRIAILHGLGEHGGRYAALAEALVRAGAAVCTVDLPGHGDSPGGRGDGEWTAFRDEVVPALLDWTAEWAETHAPLVLLGHSLGGLLALDFLICHPHACAAAVLSAPGFAAATPPPAWKLTLARWVLRFAPGAPFDSALVDADRSRDDEVVRLAREDRLMHKAISPRFYFGFAEAQQRVMERASELTLPVLVLQGDADRIVSVAATRAFVERCRPEYVSARTYPGMFHELYNDVGRERVVDDTMQWLKGLPVVASAAAPAAPAAP